MQENRLTNHSIVIEQRKNITVNGVESVSAFSEVKITLILQGGDRLHIAGSNLRITAFSKTNGTFIAEGNITGVSYGGKSFTARLFR